MVMQTIAHVNLDGLLVATPRSEVQLLTVSYALGQSFVQLALRSLR
jgi:hypothetical protein